ncbi:MAG: hypothetical protein LKE85_13475 [Lachnospiraceae bacterium]|nr:hypothetical protein [Lachnospiraceae bacterium]MCI1453311.1 hypothetical protein [Lachnospiraceae bacterium]
MKDYYGYTYYFTPITNDEAYTDTVYYYSKGLSGTLYFIEYGGERYSNNTHETRLQAANRALTNTTNGLAKTCEGVIILDKN